jgi:ComF family protein
MLHSWVDPFVSLFLKPVCPLCQRSGQSPFCLTCDRALQRQKIANPLGDRSVQSAAHTPGAIPNVQVGDKVGERLPSDRVFAWGYYGGSLRQALWQLKYERQPAIAAQMGTWLAQAWLEHSPYHTPHSRSNFSPIVVPIPLSKERRQQRGYNQAELIARSFCQWTGYACQPHGLIRQRDTQAQHQLGAQDRQRNLSGAFSLGKSWGKSQHAPSRQKPILLIDDIYTTGATVQTAVQVFEQAGIPVWGVAIVARGASGSEPSKERANPKLDRQDRDLNL